jgi:hypothetical protein
MKLTFLLYSDLLTLFVFVLNILSQSVMLYIFVVSGCVYSLLLFITNNNNIPYNHLTHTRFDRQPHCVIECWPIAPGVDREAQMFFKEVKRGGVWQWWIYCTLICCTVELISF